MMSSTNLRSGQRLLGTLPGANMLQRNKLAVLSNFFGMIPSRPATLKERDLVGAEGGV